ncbi:MAG TPA: hypothetical protein VGP36_03345 [Mycobacteriales bacterium]|jgi:hypothetical protein|nr:hypothetical protein [Mycobacteriales bacterium]
MALFSNRRAERQAQEQRAAAALNRLEEAQSAFTREFKRWIERISQAYVDHGTSGLTEEILERAGRLSRIDASGLERTQLIYIQGFLGSYTGASIRRHRATSVVAAARSRDPDLGVDHANSYWDNVELYVGSLLA